MIAVWLVKYGYDINVTRKDKQVAASSFVFFIEKKYKSSNVYLR